MASLFSADDLDAIWDSVAGGDDAQGTYTPYGEAAITGIRAIVDRGVVIGEAGEESDVLTFQRTAIEGASIAGSILDATWTDGTDTWTLGQVVGRDEDEVRVAGRRST